MRSHYYLMIGALALPLLGCVRSKAFRLQPEAQPYPPVPADSVKMYVTLENLDRPYVQIAVISARGDADFTTEQRFREALAGRRVLWAATPLLSDMRTPGTGARVARRLLGLLAERKAGVMCVRILDPPGGA